MQIYIILFFAFLGLLVLLKLTSWVYHDAAKRRLKSPQGWATLVFLFNIFAFIPYLILRHKKIPITCDFCGFDLTDEFDQTNIFICPNCKKLLHADVTSDIFFSKIRQFESKKIQVYDYSGLVLEDINRGRNTNEMFDIVKFYLYNAIANRASDLHFDPEKDKVRIRQRIDGVLYDCISPPKEIGIRLTATLKSLAGLDIAQKRESQSGRFSTATGQRSYDLRVSTSYAIFGEKVTIRLLDREGAILKLEKLGFFEDELRQIENIIAQPHGMILLCGPTGCGKTTTLYSMLKKIDPKRRNIITIEDPVEYELQGVNQQQINVKAGVNFASGLRSILRHDPDVIMVGEIRDSDTATIAHQAADTGHLVLSTIHSIDAVNVITRLRDFGVGSHYISSSLLLIIAQRLVRTLCPHCKEKAASTGNVESDSPRVKNIYKPKGCHKCRYTGYLGRTGIFELLSVNKELSQLIYKDSSPDEIRSHYAEWGIQNLRQKALRKVAAGLTTLSEVDSVVPEARFFTKKEI